ncbi:MAG TPA: ABC transporter substrate-binding protein [Nitrospiraceae bacterium]|nr:ABC transporter substrate-binding protein [Nitrospiraceae bacterium]
MMTAIMRAGEKNGSNAVRRIAMSLLWVVLVFSGPAASAALAGGPTEAMKSMIDEVLRIIRDKELKQPEKTEERRRLLQKTVGDRFDFQEMSRRSLGAQWAKLSDPEKQEFVALFRSLLMNSYTEKVETYSGEGVVFINEKVEKDYAEVRTKLLSGKTELPLDYRMINRGADWQAYDVIVDGVSLVSNYRGQFTKIIQVSSYSDLVDQLRKKSDKLKSP